MKWRQKAFIQKLVAMLPSGLSYSVHYANQRWFGGLDKIFSSQEHLRGGVTIIDSIISQGREIESKTFLELGPGRHLTLPIALWLCGASKVITVDLNPYLKAEVVLKYIASMRNNPEHVRSLFGRHSHSPVFQQRLQQLTQAPGTLKDLFMAVPIEYHAPADAAHLSLPDQTIDYYISYNVMEFIPPEVLKNILLEGKRILKRQGLHIHSVDFADWFAVSDRSISGINFLQFSEREWHSYAGNRYMYHNRMRVDDFAAMFKSAGLKILTLDATIDDRALDELKKGFPLDQRFKNKSRETNATSHAWIVASPVEA